MLLVLWNEVTQSLMFPWWEVFIEVLKKSKNDLIFQLNLVAKSYLSRNYYKSSHWKRALWAIEALCGSSPTIRAWSRGNGDLWIRVFNRKLELSHQKLIETHIFEKTHLGILTGSSLTDVHIKLITGRAHQKHTSGGILERRRIVPFVKISTS